MTVIRPNSISGVTSITAQGGEISYFKSDGTRGNQFTHNIHSTGIITATSFVGSGTALTGIDASTIKFGNDVKVAANNSGAIVTGILTVTKNADLKTVVTGSSVGIGTTTTAGRNAGVGTAVGTIIFNSTANKLEVYANDLNWRGFSPADPNISSISGTLYAGQTSTLTLAGSNFLTANLQVRFVQSTRSVDATVTVTPSSDAAASVTVPASVYNNIQAADVVTISVTNSDNIASNTVTRTASGLPTGGTVTTSGSYRIHSFTSGGTFVVPTGTTLTNVEYLVVAGGGGGGGSQQGHQGGGGGAGGLRTSVVGATSGRGSSAEARQTITAGSYTVTIGQGGGGASADRGGDGSNSTFNGITAIGGGGGGNGQNNGTARSGGDGGCGGGAGSSDQSFPSRAPGTAGQGYDGGLPTQQGSGRAGAGGGAGAQGTDPPSGGVPSGNTAGGAGLANSITGSSVTYAKGGECQGTGGSAPAGTDGKGEGGTGGYSHGSTSTGRDGGNGIVIVRYILP